MSLRQMGFLCRSLKIAVLGLAVSSCGGGGSSGPAGPGPTEPEEDASVPGVPKPVPDVGTVTPPPGPGPDGAPPATPDAPPSAPPPAGGVELVVEAGTLDRQNTIVSFPFAAGVGKWFALRDGQGAQLPVQMHENGQAVFVLPALKAGALATFTLQELPGAPPGALAAAKEGDGVVVGLGATKIFRYQTTGKLPGGVGGNYLRGGYIHPMFTPGGLQVTDDYPGDHRHHHGIWSAWAHTTFEGRTMDFWNMGGGSAKVDFESLTSTWDGPVHAGFRAKHLHTDLRGNKTALREEWLVTVYRAAPEYFVFDLDSTQEAASASPVNLDQYIYGGFAFRGSPQWRSGATFLTSEGKERGNGDGSTARWCYIGGKVDTKQAGYAVLGHPTNFRAPQPMRINPTDPFFSYAPVRPSGFQIVMGKPYLTRFRVVVTDGEPDKALFDRQWSDYADPPKVTLKN